jgi:hypothetical protein
MRPPDASWVGEHMTMRSLKARAGLALLLIGCRLPALSAEEGVVGRVTFVGTLGEERLPDGSVQARFRFRLSESDCSTTVGLWTRIWTGSSWTGWQQLSSMPLASDPAAVVVSPNRIDVFALGPDNRIYEGRWEGGRWTDWTPIGNEFFNSGPAAAFEPGNNWVHVFARGQSDNALWSNQWRGTWSGWQRLAPQPIAPEPAAASWGQGRVDVFARGTDNKMYRLFVDHVQTPAWQPMGQETFSSGPGVASWTSGRLHLFARRTDNFLYHNLLDGSGWRLVEGGIFASDPAVVARSLTSNVYVPRADNQIYFAEIRRDGVLVTPWTSLGGSLAGGAAVVSTGGNHEQVFVRGRDRADRWFHVRSGRVDGSSPHNLATFRNAYHTVLTAFLARSVASVQVGGVPSCGEGETISLDAANIGLLP